MYISGKCNGTFELLEVIKTTAISAGWSVLNENTVPYSDIPRDALNSYSEGDIGAISSSVSSSSSSFKVIMPRDFSVIGISFVGSASVTIYGIGFDQTRELLCSDVSSGYKFSEEIQKKKFIQIEVIATVNISDFHLEIKSDYPNLEKNLTITNGDNSNNAILNFSSFIQFGGKTNMAITTSTGYSPNLRIENQLNSKVGYVLGDDKEIEYLISINHHRLIMALKIHRPDDSVQKNEVWQLVYLGRIRLYGGEWALPDANAIITTAFTSRKWNEGLKNNITKPFVYFSGSFSEANSTAFSSSTTSAINCNIEAPQGGEIFSSPVICYNTNNIFGELDGLYNIVPPDGVGINDEISLENRAFIIVSDGTGFSKFDTFAMIKE